MKSATAETAFEYGRDLGKQAEAFQELINRVSPRHYRAVEAGFLRELHAGSRSSTEGRNEEAFPWQLRRLPCATPTSGLFRRLALATILLLMIPCTVIAGTFAVPETTNRIATYAISLVPARLTAWLGMRAGCALRLPVWDRRGRLAGITKADSSCRDIGYRSTAVSEAAALQQAEADAAIEGEISGPGVLLNINLWGLGRVLKYSLAEERVGGSNLLQSALENAAGEPGRLRALRKLSFLFLIGPHYVAHNLPTLESRASFAVENAACAMAMPRTGGNFGAPIAGDLCALVVSKSSLDDLHRGERCIVAATRKRHLRVPGKQANEVHFATYAAQFAELKDRAKNLCADRIAVNEAEANSLRAQIDAVQLPAPETFNDIDARLARTLPVASQLLSDLKLPEEQRDRLDLTIDPRVQQEVTGRARHFARKILVPALRHPLCWGLHCPDQQRADLALAVFEVVKGRLEMLGAYQSRAKLLTGPSSRPVDRSLASTTKALLVPILIEAGVKQVCRRAAAGLQDADGYTGGDCSKPHEWLNLRQALAISSNLAFVDGLNQLNPRRLRSYLEELGFRVLAGTSDRQLARSAILGDKVMASPLTLVRAFAALAYAADGVGMPSVLQGDDSPQLRLHDLVQSRVIHAARRIIAAPLHGGTAAAALPILKRAGCRAKAAKTGTADSVQELRYRDKLIVIAAECNGRKLLVFALAGSPEIRWALGNVRSADLARLASKVIVRSGKL